MKRTRSVLAAATAAVALVVVLPSPAGAADGDSPDASLSATVTASSIGSRSIALPSAVTMSSALDSATLSSTYSVLVEETARTGTNPWSVTAVVSAALSDGLGNTIPASALDVSGRGVVQVASGGTSAAPSGTSALSSAATLFSNTGQLANTVYTGTHTATGTITLTPPNGTKAGVYTGTLVLALIQ